MSKTPPFKLEIKIISFIEKHKKQRDVDTFLMISFG